MRRLVAGFREAEAAEKAAAAMPSYGSTVTVMSESQVGWAALLATGSVHRHRPLAVPGHQVWQPGLHAAVRCSGTLPAMLRIGRTRWSAQPAPWRQSPPPMPQKLMHKMERKAQRRAAGKGGIGSSAALKELGDEDADWVRSGPLDVSLDVLWLRA